MSKSGSIGEGNAEADRRYREAVRETTEQTTGREREEKARDVTAEEKSAIRDAEEKARSRARN